jgi:cell division protein ZapA (FtsZ GTPase activity inhibitor)
VADNNDRLEEKLHKIKERSKRLESQLEEALAKINQLYDMQ